MPRRFIALLAGVAFFVGIILMVALRRQPPDTPDDDVHRAVRSRPDQCMSCHGPGGSKPRGPNHPFGERCDSCHFFVGERG